MKILPNRPSDGQPATIEIHEVEAMLAENTESQELREFPGPLIRYAGLKQKHCSRRGEWGWRVDDTFEVHTKSHFSTKISL